MPTATAAPSTSQQPQQHMAPQFQQPAPSTLPTATQTPAQYATPAPVPHPAPPSSQSAQSAQSAAKPHKAPSTKSAGIPVVSSAMAASLAQSGNSGVQAKSDPDYEPSEASADSKQTKSAVPAFISKLMTMINDPDTDHLISWTEVCLCVCVSVCVCVCCRSNPIRM